MMENVNYSRIKYELLEMSKNQRIRRPCTWNRTSTKKDRRELEEFTTPEFMDDFDFDFDFDSEE